MKKFLIIGSIAGIAIYFIVPLIKLAIITLILFVVIYFFTRDTEYANKEPKL